MKTDFKRPFTSDATVPRLHDNYTRWLAARAAHPHDATDPLGCNRAFMLALDHFRSGVEPTERSDREIVAQTETVAQLLMREFHQREPAGTVVMRDSADPRAQHCWRVACRIQEAITATDPENSVSAVDDEPLQAVGADVPVLRAVLDVLRLARNSHGKTLLTDPPQDAWGARSVDAKLADAAGLLERLISVCQADASLAQAVEQVQWIRCADRMPDAETSVQAYLPPEHADAEGMVIGAFWDGEQWRGAGDGWPLGQAVTWWAAELTGPGALA